MRLLIHATILSMLVLAGCGDSPQPTASESANQPNIIFVLIDDQRLDFLSSRGHPWIKTPNIDELVERSLYFDRAYVTTSLCSPSRASILTGQYAHTHRVIDNDTEIPAGTPTFPQELQKSGYRTAFVGKWHMGGANDMPRPGFDYWASFRGQGVYTDPELNIDGERVQRTGYTPDVLTELSVSFIEEQQDSEEPYFLYLSHKSIHEPFTPAPRHEGAYADLEVPRPGDDEDFSGKPEWLKRQRQSWHGADRDFSRPGSQYADYQEFFQRYSECMLAVDDSIGKITATLKELGQLEDTVIIYYSDNGYMIGEHGLIDKRVMYEESIRVPAFIHWPAQIQRPGVNSEFILNVDIGPTILDLAGVTKPETMHGQSFLPLVTGGAVDWREDFVYEYFIDPKAVQTPTIFGLRNKQYSYMTYHGVWDAYELYDMEQDPNQLNNLLGEVAYGQGYGGLLRYAEQQAPEVYPAARELDDRLTELLTELGGSRQPKWTDYRETAR